jgi:outer membrane protein assembly factor BamB
VAKSSLILIAVLASAIVLLIPALSNGSSSTPPISSPSAGVPALVGGAAAVADSSGAAANSSMAPVHGWTEFRYNSAHTGASTLPGPLVPGIEWRSTGGTLSSPIIEPGGSIVAATSNGGVAAHGPLGEVEWKFTIPGFHEDFLSTPAVAPNGDVVIGSQDGTVYGLYPAAGSFSTQVAWTVVTGGPVISSPTLGPNGTIFVGSNDGRVYAIHPNGLVAWTFATSGAVESSPAVGPGGIVYVGSNDGNLYAIQPNGTLDWKLDLGTALFSSPAIGSNGTIYIGGTNGDLYAALANGTLGWTFPTNGSILSSPAISPSGSIYFGSSNGNLYALNPNGSEQWQFSTQGAIVASPAVDSNGVVYVGSDDSHLYAVKSNGSIDWSFATNGRVKSSPIIGKNRTLYVSVLTTAGASLLCIGTLHVTFTESGLPAGQRWVLQFNGSNYSGRNSTIAVQAVPGTFSWNAPLLPCGIGCRYNGSSGQVNTAATDHVSLQFVHSFRVSFSVTPRGTGSTNPRQNSSLWVTAGQLLKISARAYQLYVFVDWSSSSGNITFANGTAKSTTALVGGPGEITGNFAAKIGAPRVPERFPLLDGTGHPIARSELTAGSRRA